MGPSRGCTATFRVCGLLVTVKPNRLVTAPAVRAAIEEAARNGEQGTDLMGRVFKERPEMKLAIASIGYEIYQ